MNFDWTSYFIGFSTFPLLCLLFIAVMMFACRRMRFGCCDAGAEQRSPQSRHEG